QRNNPSFFINFMIVSLSLKGSPSGTTSSQYRNHEPRLHDLAHPESSWITYLPLSPAPNRHEWKACGGLFSLTTGTNILGEEFLKLLVELDLVVAPIEAVTFALDRHPERPIAGLHQGVVHIFGLAERRAFILLTVREEYRRLDLAGHGEWGFRKQFSIVTVDDALNEGSTAEGTREITVVGQRT